MNTIKKALASLMLIMVGLKLAEIIPYWSSSFIKVSKDNSELLLNSGIALCLILASVSYIFFEDKPTQKN